MAGLSHRSAGMIVLALIISSLTMAQPAGPQLREDSNESAEGFVAALYQAVSAGPGTIPDWEKVRSFFLKEAVVVLRTSRTRITTFTLDGFIKDFSDFYERPIKIGDVTLRPKVDGFFERVVRTRAWTFRTMAHVLVLYEAHIPGAPRNPQQGIDSFILTRSDGRWFIAGITNELITPEHPIPAELRAVQ